MKGEAEEKVEDRWSSFIKAQANPSVHCATSYYNPFLANSRSSHNRTARSSSLCSRVPTSGHARPAYIIPDCALGSHWLSSCLMPPVFLSRWINCCRTLPSLRSGERARHCLLRSRRRLLDDRSLFWERWVYVSRWMY